MDALPEVSLTPLIDTALTLLIIFMVTTPMMHNSIKLELPKGRAKEDGNTKQKLIVSIDKKENLFFNDEAIQADNLIERIKKEVGSDKGKTVEVQADRAVLYGWVMEIVDKIKVLGGVQYVVLAMQKVV